MARTKRTISPSDYSGEMIQMLIGNIYRVTSHLRGGTHFQDSRQQILMSFNMLRFQQLTHLGEVQK